MASKLIEVITSSDPAIRDSSLDPICQRATVSELLGHCAELEAFRRTTANLYERVRALFFLYAIHRFHLPQKAGSNSTGLVPFEGYEHLLNRRFEEAIATFLAAQTAHQPGEAISSALAAAYRDLGFQTLADQVRHSVRSTR